MIKPAIERAGGTIFATRNSYRNPKIIVHRGLHTLAPENSLPAFRIAGEMGAWAIETDLHKTRDGVTVCCHNETVDSIYDGEGAIADLTYDELRRFRQIKGAGLKLYPAEDYRIPTLDEYLNICMRYGSVPFIEFKNDLIEETLFHIRSLAMEDYTVFSSVKYDLIEKCRTLTDRVFLHWIFGNEEGAEALAELGYAGMSYKIAKLDDVPDGLVESTHRLGLRVTFRAQDTRENALRAIDMGVDYFPSNTLVTL